MDWQTTETWRYLICYSKTCIQLILNLQSRAFIVITYRNFSVSKFLCNKNCQFTRAMVAQRFCLHFGVVFTALTEIQFTSWGAFHFVQWSPLIFVPWKRVLWKCSFKWSRTYRARGFNGSDVVSLFTMCLENCWKKISRFFVFFWVSEITFQNPKKCLQG